MRTRPGKRHDSAHPERRSRGRPQSATAPSRPPRCPPRPIDSPIDEARSHADVLRHVLLAHHHRHAERADDGGADDDERDRTADTAGEDEDRDRRRDDDDSTRGAPGSCRSGRRRALRVSVPAAPASSMIERRKLPYPSELPIDTSHSGTNVMSPNHATLRTVTTPSNRAIAPRRSSPAAARAS